MSNEKKTSENKDETFQTSSQCNTNDTMAPTVDHSRWMTETWEDIADLKIQNMAIPSTHNSGADMKSLWGIEELYAACQDDTFDYQLRIGARAFDLRIADYSYHVSQGIGYRLVEEMGFEHLISTGRRLEHCVETMRAFAVANPRELIILYIRSYTTGKVRDSIERCRRYLAPLNSLLLPPDAKNLTLRQISQSYPGRNVIITASPEALITGNVWPQIVTLYTADASYERLETFTKATFEGVSSGVVTHHNYIWTFNANARNATGPIRFSPDHPYFSSFYDKAQNKGVLANIINADFIESIKLVDFCIETNKERGKKYPLPAAPTGLSASQIELTEQVKLTWHAPTNAPVVRYEISVNGQIELTPHGTSGILQTVPPGIYTYKVRAVDALDRRSDYSSEFPLHVKDIAPPSTPGKLRLADVRMNSAKLTWTESFDVVGIKRYEVKCNGDILGHTEALFYPLTNLDHASEYNFEVRAQDNSDFYSKVASITLARRPEAPISPSFTIDELEWSAGKHFGVLEWKENYSSNLDYDYQVKILPSTVIYVAKSALAHWMLVDEGIVNTVEIRARLRGGDELSDPVTHTFTADTSRPGKVTGLNSTIIGETSATLAWVLDNKNVGGYGILIHGAAPAFIPPSGSYTTHKMVLGEDNVAEVWAVNALGVPGESDAIMLSGGPTRPGTPAVNNITATSATITWTRSARSAGYEVSLGNATPITTSQLSHTFSNLKETTSYTVQIRAIDSNGRYSPPTNAQFTTKQAETLPPLPPTNLRETYNQSKIVKLAWDAPAPELMGYVVTVLGKPTNVRETNHTMYNMVPGIPFRISVQSKNYGNILSEKVFITVVPIL